MKKNYILTPEIFLKKFNQVPRIGKFSFRLFKLFGTLQLGFFAMETVGFFQNSLLPWMFSIELELWGG